MKRFIIVWVILLFAVSGGICNAAELQTSHYGLIVPEFGTTGWGVKLSRDIITLDSVMYMLSRDVDRTWISGDGTALYFDPDDDGVAESRIFGPYGTFQLNQTVGGHEDQPAIAWLTDGVNYDHNQVSLYNSGSGWAMRFKVDNEVLLAIWNADAPLTNPSYIQTYCSIQATGYKMSIDEISMDAIVLSPDIGVSASPDVSHGSPVLFVSADPADSTRQMLIFYDGSKYNKLSYFGS